MADSALATEAAFQELLHSIEENRKVDAAVPIGNGAHAKSAVISTTEAAPESEKCGHQVLDCRSAVNLKRSASVAQLQMETDSCQELERSSLPDVSRTQNQVSFLFSASQATQEAAVPSHELAGAELAESRWKREDGSWSKKYYKCHILTSFVDSEGVNMCTVVFLQDNSIADVPLDVIRSRGGMVGTDDNKEVACKHDVISTSADNSNASNTCSTETALEKDKAEVQDGSEVLSSNTATQPGRGSAESMKGREMDLQKAPPFDQNCNGTPLVWNQVKPLIWGRRVKKRECFAYMRNSSLDESLHRVRDFLRMRRDAHGNPILDKLYDFSHGARSEGWHRFTWGQYYDDGGDAALPLVSPGKFGPSSDWQTAWHGCKFEALYSIMYHGRLFASSVAERGDRFHDSAPGVYVHKDATCAKTGNYFRFVPLCRDGVFWAALWEVMVDRADRFPVKGTDQWVQHERSVKLKALWLAGCTYEGMEPGWEVSEVWDPLLEANPFAMDDVKDAPSSHHPGAGDETLT